MRNEINRFRNQIRATTTPWSEENRAEYEAKVDRVSIGQLNYIQNLIRDPIKNRQAYSHLKDIGKKRFDQMTKEEASDLLDMMNGRQYDVKTQE